MPGITVTPEADRKSRIEQAPVLRPYRIPGRTDDLPVVSLPLSLAVYRLQNMRTSVAQRVYLRDHNRPDTFFSAGQEDPEAQAVQHELLLEKAKADGKDIYRKLSEVAEQTEPLLVTEAGVVLNGNRRLAAMRDLFASDPGRFHRFENIEVALLPRSDESALSALETDLQIAEDLRLPYGWVEEALGLRHQTEDLKWPLAQAAMHWGKRPAQLTALLNQLTLAEQYLRHIGEPLRYELVENDQQAFETLQQRLAAHLADGADPSRIEAERLVMFAVLLHSRDGTIEGRTYEYATKIEEITTRVMPALAAAPIPPVAPEVLEEQTAPTQDANDPFADLPQPAATVPQATLEALKDLGNATAIAQAADQARDDIATEARRDRRGNALVRSAREVHTDAVSLSLTNADPTTYDAALAQLVASLGPIASCLQAMLMERPELINSLDVEALAAARETLAAISERQPPE